ncbi:MAG: cytidylyltransferase domain-containing protein [Rhodoglobus sp.]
MAQRAVPRVVAIIPARGGSKGIRGKNLRTVGGVSLLARAVRTAVAAARIDEVVVSTDSTELAAVARREGVAVVFRPEDLASDTASSEDALLHALDTMDGSADIVVFLQATSPFIDPDDVDAAVQRVAAGERDVVFSARRSHAFLWRETEQGLRGVNHDESFRQRRQDCEPQFYETGAFYVMRAEGFRAAGFRFFGRIGVALVRELTAIEIDTTDDLQLASAIAPLLTSRERIDVDAVVTDFDGVHTDDRVHVGADGSEFVTASRSDGMGVDLLRRAGMPILIISTETNPVVSARARKLQVEVQQAVTDKAAVLTSWASENNLDLGRIAFVGNDVNDLGCLALVGWPVAVADAHPAVLAASRVILSRRGGRGALRELADRIVTLTSDPEPIADPEPNQEEICSRSVPTP